MFNTIKKIAANIRRKSSDQLFSSLAILPFSSRFKNSWGMKEYLSAYKTSLYTNKAINKRAEKVGEIEFTLQRGEQPIEKHEILDLLAKPNKAFTASEFWSLYQKCYDTFGEVYLHKEQEGRMGGRKKISSLQLLRPWMVKPFFNNEDGTLLYIEYRTAEGTTIIEGEEIIYSHNPDPENPLRGESLLQAGIRQIELATQIDEYHSKVLENGGRVEGVFNFKNEKITQQQLSEVQDAYQEKYGEAAKAGRPLFLAGNATYERLGLNPAELAYLETKKVNLQDITMLTGVPQAILGVTSDETFANSDAAIRVFLRETIKPLMRALVTKLDEDLVEDGLELNFIDPTPEDKEEKRKDMETANTINAITLNEKRELLGLDPIKNGDQIFAPMNLVPLATEKPTPKEPEEKNVNKKINHPLRDIENRRIYHALQVKRLDKRQDKMVDLINSYFKEQEKRIVESLEGRKQFKVKGLITEVFNTTLEVKLAKDTVLPVLEELIKDSAEDAKEIAGSDWEYQQTASVDSWLDSKATVFAEQINNTTFKKLQSEFSESLNAGETRQELIRRIENTYGDISKARAATIARTEVHGVTQYGTLEGYKQAGLPIKIWVWAPGTQGGVRDAHQAMDGEEVPIDTAFSNGLTAPGVNGSAAEVVNCQCFI